MKTYVLLILSYLMIANCFGQSPNGWYLITNTETMEYDRTPILTVTDFEALKLDSTQQSATSNLFPGQVVFQIIGKIKTDKMKVFADATEKYIGKQIGFLYNGEIISAPKINLRIEGGNFAITPSYMNDRDKMTRLYEDLKKELTSSKEQQFAVMSQKDKESYLIHLGKEVTKTHGPGYYREFGTPVIQEKIFASDDKRQEVQQNVGREYYDVIFPYDTTKEQLEWDFASCVSIWKDTGEPQNVIFGNGMGINFLFEPYKKADARSGETVKQIPYQKAAKRRNPFKSE